MWRDILLIVVTLYVARHWYRENYSLFHGERKVRWLDLRNGDSMMLPYHERWSGLRRFFRWGA